MFEDVLQVDPDAEETALIAQIGDLETMKAAAAAAQARATAQLVAKRRAAEAARGVPAAKRGRGLAGEIALARRDSPACGGRHLGFATALVHEMPHTLAALESGVLSEWRATLIVRESACLDVDDRARLDAELCADPTRLEGKGDKRIAADAKAIAYRLDPHAVVDRAVRAESERTVTVRPAPDCMAYVTALLPMTQGVAVYAAVKRAADTCFDGRSRGQVMADTLVERVTGRPAEVPTPIAVNLVISDDTLLGAGTEPARLTGYGPVPAAVACWLARGLTAVAGDGGGVVVAATGAGRTAVAGDGGGVVGAAGGVGLAAVAGDGGGVGAPQARSAEPPLRDRGNVVVADEGGGKAVVAGDSGGVVVAERCRRRSLPSPVTVAVL